MKKIIKESVLFMFSEAVIVRGIALLTLFLQYRLLERLETYHMLSYVK